MCPAPQRQWRSLSRRGGRGLAAGSGKLWMHGGADAVLRSSSGCRAGAKPATQEGGGAAAEEP